MYNKEKLLQLNYFIENEYFEKYLNIIEKNKKTKKIKFETNAHHIIPRHYFIHNNLNIDNSKENIVNLYYKDHMLAHFYLAGCTIGRDKYWNLYSIYLLSGKSTNLSYIENIKSLEDFDFIYNNAIKSDYNHRKGSKVSDETKDKMKKAQQLRVKLHGATNKDYVWINNDIKDYMIPQDELENYLVDGFKKGRLYRHSKEVKEKIGEKAKKRIITDEFRKKMSEIAKKQIHTSEQNKAHSEWMKKHSIGSRNPFYGKHHSKKSNEQNRQAHLERVWMTNGEELKFVKKEEVDHYLSIGFIKGRKIKNKGD